jgi:hypothetical protein
VETSKFSKMVYATQTKAQFKDGYAGPAVSGSANHLSKINIYLKTPSRMAVKDP